MVRPSVPALAAALAPLLWCLAVVVAFLAPRPAAAAAPPAHGVALLVLGEAELADRAWPLAQAVYASRVLLPPGVTEARARTLVGRAAAAGAEDTRELAELRDGVHDEGAVSRRVLGAIAGTTQAAAVAVVRPSETPGHVQVRLYLVDRAAFDVTLYDGDPTDGAWRTDLVQALERRFDPAAKAAPPVVAKAAPLHDTRNEKRPFYKSPWFWGALGGAVLLGGTALLVTKVTENTDVRVRVEPPASAAAALHF